MTAYWTLKRLIILQLFSVYYISSWFVVKINREVGTRSPNRTVWGAPPSVFMVVDRLFRMAWSRGRLTAPDDPRGTASEEPPPAVGGWPPGPVRPPMERKKTGPGWSLFFFYLGRRPTRTLRCGHFVLAADACELMMHRWDQSANDGLLWQSRTGSVGSRIVKCCWMEASGVVRVWWVIAFAFCDLLLCLVVLVVLVVVRLRLKPS